VGLVLAAWVSSPTLSLVALTLTIVGMTEARKGRLVAQGAGRG
jgi:hypothetical protein